MLRITNVSKKIKVNINVEPWSPIKINFKLVLGCWYSGENKWYAA